MSAARGLLRFWWLVVLGLAAGVVGAGALISHEPPTIYTANDTVLVNSADAPYLRTVQPAAPVTTASKSSSKKKKQATVKSTTPAPTPPNTQVLVNAANLYPLFMQSDEIRKLRISLYGPTPGRVTANAIASSTNTYGVYHPSPLPVIMVKATSRRSKSAQKLAVDTVKAFGIWIVRHQQEAGVPRSQRINVEQLRVRVQSSSGTTYSLPAFAALVCVLAFCGLAVLADRVWPRRAEATEAGGARMAPSRHVA